MKSKKIFIIALTTILALAGTASYWLVSKPQRQKNSNLITSQATKPTESKIYSYTSTEYYTVVTGLKNPKINITSTELKSAKNIYRLSSYQSKLVGSDFLYSLNYKDIASANDLIKALNSELNSFAIMAVQDLSPKVKVLSVDGHYLFDKTTDLITYPLKSITKNQSSQAQEDQANYSHAMLTKIGHTGSMISGRGVNKWIKNKFNNDYTTLFKSTKLLFDTFDYLSSTFETPVLGEGNLAQCEHCTTFIGPEKFMDGVKYSGIDFYSMAANHVMDGGVRGMARTQELLNQLGIKYTGGSTINNDDAGKPVLVDINGIKVAYLAFNDTPGREEWAMESKPGAASISDWEIDASGKTTKYQPNEARIKYFLQRAKDLKPDYIFVIMHWSAKEYINKALPYTRKLGDLLIQNGADVILGDHPHWVAEIEFNHDKPIFYSVGNFIFDQMWSIETRQGMTIELDFVNKKLVNFRLHPHQLNLYEKGTIELLKPTDPGYQQTLDRVWKVSEIKE